MSRNGAATAKKPRRDTKPSDFRYGWRYVRRVGPNGKEILEEVPLTLEDVLHPQEGDVIPENSLHGDERSWVSAVFKARTDRLRRPRVFTDCLIDWGVPGMQNHAPDISVFENVADLDGVWGIFPMREQGAEAVLALELVSPETRTNDVVDKVTEYHRARIPLYVIVDQERLGGPRSLIGYRWTPRRYVRMPRDRQGRLLLAPLGLRLGLVENRLVCYDAETNEVMGEYSQVLEERDAAEAARQEEAAAREAAEAAREAAETARQTAEDARQEEAAARQAAEARIRELETQLRQSSPSGKPGPTSSPP